MDTLLKQEQSKEHPLREILEDVLGFSGTELRQELRWHGHDVFPGRIYFMLRGHESMPEEVEAALRRVAAEHMEERPLTHGEADQVIERWLHGDEHEPSQLSRL